MHGVVYTRCTPIPRIVNISGYPDIPFQKQAFKRQNWDKLLYKILFSSSLLRFVHAAQEPSKGREGERYIDFVRFGYISLLLRAFGSAKSMVILLWEPK